MPAWPSAARFSPRWRHASASGTAATIAETALGLLLIAGIRLRWTATASALLLAVFALSMAISFGIKSPLDASVFSASAAALLLARAGDAGSATSAGSRG